MHKRYTTLRILSAIYKLVGLLLGLFGVAAFAFALYVALGRPDQFYPTNLPDAYLVILIAGAAAFLGGLVLALLIFAGGVMLDLYLSLEEHTRATSIYMKRMLQAQNRRTPPPAPTSQQIRSVPSRTTATLPTVNPPTASMREPHVVAPPSKPVQSYLSSAPVMAQPAVYLDEKTDIFPPKPNPSPSATEPANSFVLEGTPAAFRKRDTGENKPVLADSNDEPVFIAG